MNFVLDLLGVVLVSVVSLEAWGWLPRLSRMIIWLETALLAREERLVRRKEWYAELAAEYDDRRLSGLLWTLKLCPISLWELAKSLLDASEKTKKGVESSDTVVVADSARVAVRSAAASLSLTTGAAIIPGVARPVLKASPGLG